ncbi:hypothetical protein [Clostridium hydrogeniformans]|uniref:hypothetical protein n=1 Tax=Clostridium hydrogeniformans TaxID=349933 RepID=UPI000483741F|nr:hypothetical protein [Clostridium hydrogeniformans]
MPIVTGLNKIYNDIELRKTKNDLSSMKIGQVVSAKVIEKLGDRDVILRLQEGWNFRGELSEDVVDLKGEYYKFKVEGFEDGKLKLKLLNGQERLPEASTESIEDLIIASGFSKEDGEIIKSLLKHNIPITKDNIEYLKSIIKFKDDYNKLGKDSVQDFINKYISAKGLKEGSEEYNFIKSTLNSGLKAVLSMNKEDILFFLENSLNINEDNLETFEKLFKNEKTLDNNIKEGLKEGKENSSHIKNIEGSLEDNILESSNIELSNKENGDTIKEVKTGVKVLEEGDKKDNKASLNNTLDLKEEVIKNIETNTLDKKDGKTLESSKHIEGKESKIINEEKIHKVLEKLDVKTFVGSLKEGKQEEAIKELKTSLNNLSKEEKEVVLDRIFKGISDESHGKTPNKNNVSTREYTMVDEFKNIPKEEVKVLKDILLKIKEDINTKSSNLNEVKEGLKGKGEGLKELVRQVLNGDVEKIPKEFIKEVKFFNEVSKEYYYMDVPIKARDKDYGCKIIVKDKRGEGVAIDSKNMKLIVSVDAPKMGKVDGYLRVYDNNISITLKAKSPFHNAINFGKEKLCSYIRDLGYNVTVEVYEKSDDINISNCSEFFNDYRTIALNTLV